MATVKIDTLETSSDEFVQELRPPLVVAGDQLEVSTFRAGLNELYKVSSIAGRKPSAEVFLKIYSADTPAECQEALGRLSDLHRCFNSRNIGIGWAKSFLALPYQAFMVTLNGKPELAALMLDITPLGYEDCPFGPNGKSDTYVPAPFELKAALASSLIEKAELMAAAGWIHADINPPNLMFGGSDVQIIDFDSGTLVGSNRPAGVAGKGDFYLAPEAKRLPLPPGCQYDLSRLNLESDRWSCAMLIATILFLAPPIMFLRHDTAEMIDDYAASGRKWPDFDPAASYASTDPGRLDAHRQLTDLMNQFAPGVIDLFSRLFSAGSNGSARPTLAEWRHEIDSLITPLSVNVLTVSEDVVLEGDLIELEGDVDGADWVKINEHDHLPPAGMMQVAVTATTQYILEAGNACNVIRHMGPVVRAAPMPKAETIKIPAGPELVVPGFGSFPVAEPPRLTASEFPRFWAPETPHLHTPGMSPGTPGRLEEVAPPALPPAPPRFLPRVGLGLRWLRR